MLDFLKMNDIKYDSFPAYLAHTAYCDQGRAASYIFSLNQIMNLCINMYLDIYFVNSMQENISDA